MPSHIQLEELGLVNKSKGVKPSITQTIRPNKKILKKSAALFIVAGSASRESFASTNVEAVHETKVAKANR